MAQGRLSLLLLLAFASTGHAQAPFSTLARTLHAGQAIRFAAPGDERVTGRVTRIDQDGLTVESPTGPRHLTALPDTLWTLARRPRASALAVGAIGAGFGLLVGLLASTAALGHPDGRVTLTTTLVGAAGGAVLGGLVGAAIPNWKRQWP